MSRAHIFMGNPVVKLASRIEGKAKRMSNGYISFDEKECVLHVRQRPAAPSASPSLEQLSLTLNSRLLTLVLNCTRRHDWSFTVSWSW